MNRTKTLMASLLATMLAGAALIAFGSLPAEAATLPDEYCDTVVDSPAVDPVEEVSHQEFKYSRTVLVSPAVDPIPATYVYKYKRESWLWWPTTDRSDRTDDHVGQGLYGGPFPLGYTGWGDRHVTGQWVDEGPTGWFRYSVEQEKLKTKAVPGKDAVYATEHSGWVTSVPEGDGWEQTDERKVVDVEAVEGRDAVTHEACDVWVSWDAGTSDVEVDASTVAFPQEFLGFGVMDASRCEQVVQRDHYVGTPEAINAVLEDGWLSPGPEDSGIVTGWSFSWGGKCEETTTTTTEPTTTEPTTTEPTTTEPTTTEPTTTEPTTTEPTTPPVTVTTPPGETPTETPTETITTTKTTTPVPAVKTTPPTQKRETLTYTGEDAPTRSLMLIAGVALILLAATGIGAMYSASGRNGRHVNR